MKRIHDASRPDSFDNHYHLAEETRGHTVKMKVTSKCQKDAFSISSDDRSSHRQVRETAKEQICDSCSSRKPQSLQKLCCAQIINNEQLIQSGAHALPTIPLLCMMDVAINCFPNREVAKQINLLLEHWPCDDFNLGLIRKKHPENGFIASLVLNRFVADFEARLLNKPTATNLTQFLMTDEKKADCIELYHYLFEIAHQKKLSLTDRDRNLAPTYIITTDLIVRTKRTFRNVITTLRKFKRQGIPVEVRMVDIQLEKISLFDIATLFTEINPEFVKHFSVTLYEAYHQHILELDEILLPAVQLTSLSLDLQVVGGYEAFRALDSMANAVSLLLSHHPTIKTLQLVTFPIAGYGDKYHLPPLLEELYLDDCEMRYSDWQHWANACSVSKLKVLHIVDCYMQIGSLNDNEFFEFLKRHAATLTSITIGLETQPLTMDTLRRIAMELAQFRSLVDFNYTTKDRAEILDILRDVIPWLATIEVFDNICLNCETRPTTNDDDAFRDTLQRSLKTVCQDRGQRPYHLTRVAYETKLDYYPLIFFRVNVGGGGGVGGGGVGGNGGGGGGGNGGDGGGGGNGGDGGGGGNNGGDGGGGNGGDGGGTGGGGGMDGGGAGGGVDGGGAGGVVDGGDVNMGMIPDDEGDYDEDNDVPAGSDSNDYHDYGYTGQAEDEEEEVEDLEHFGDAEDFDNDDDDENM